MRTKNGKNNYLEKEPKERRKRSTHMIRKTAMWKSTEKNWKSDS